VLRDFICTWMRAVGLLGLIAVTLGLPASASAARLNETEPNDSRFSANGPVPADGFLFTFNVADDADWFFFRLQGRRQVELRAVRSSGQCNPNVTFEQADGQGPSRSISASPTPGSVTFTTPRDATEYIATARSFSSSCVGTQVFFQVVTPTAVIDGPLPPPSFTRTLTATAPTQVGVDVSVPIRATGEAADEDRLAAQWRTGGCPAAPPSEFSVVTGSPLALGTYDVTLNTQTPSRAGTATLCVWLQDTLGKLEPLLRQQTVTVGTPPPPPPAPVDVDRDGVSPPSDCDDTRAAVRPGIAEVIDNATDENCDGVIARRIPRNVAVTLTRLGNRYTGRLTSVDPFCVKKRTVRLRRAGSSRNYGVAVTNSSGRYTIKLTRRLRGRLYVRITDSRSATAICRGALSRRVIG